MGTKRFLRIRPDIGARESPELLPDRIPQGGELRIGLFGHRRLQGVRRRRERGARLLQCAANGRIARHGAIDQAAVHLRLGRDFQDESKDRGGGGFALRRLQVAIGLQGRLHRQPRQRYQQHHRHQRHLGAEVQGTHQAHAGLKQWPHGGVVEKAHRVLRYKRPRTDVEEAFLFIGAAGLF